jgi:hypothetical protein
MKTALLIACLLLTGCETMPPAATSDQVLARQYAARGAHGVLSGSEAQAISDSYRKTIGAPAANVAETTPSSSQ